MRSQARAKAKQISKLAELRAALGAAGFDTTAKQACALGVPPGHSSISTSEPVPPPL